MPEQLKIVIDADVNKAIAGVQKFEKAIGHLATGSIAQLRKAALLIRTQLENLTPTQLNSDFGRQLTGALKTVNTEIKTLEKNSITAGNATGGAFNKAYSGAKQLANIIPGLGIASLFGIAISAVTALGEAFVSTFNKAKLFRDATSDAIGKSASEIFKINAAVSVLKEQTSTINAQANAREFLNKATGISVDLLSKEKIASEETTAAIKKATEAIFQKALAEAFAAKSAAKQVELFEKQQKLNAALAALPTSALGFLKIGVNIGNTATAAGVLADQIEKIKKEISAIEAFGQDAFAKAFDFTKVVKPEKIKNTTDDILARARLFVKEFGDTFVLPDLEESFFKGKKQLLPIAKKLLDDVVKGNLQIKIPVQTDFEFLPTETPLTKEQLDKLTENFFKDLKSEMGVPVDLIIDPTLSINNRKLIDEKLKLQKLFEDTFGNLGVKAFGKIDFDNLEEGVGEATKQFENMKLVLDTLTASISEGLANAFNNVFDAILEGKSVFKALGEAVKALVVDTIKAIAKMFILRAVTSALGGGGVVTGLGGLIGGFGGQANFGLGGAIGNRAFNNVIQITGGARIAGNDIVLSYNRTNNSNVRNG